MKTTYFWKACNEPEPGVRYVSIAQKTPDYFFGETYPDLFPSWNIIQKAKDEDYDSFEEYKNAYVNYLHTLDLKKVYENLKDATLVCYESAKDLANGKKFCHRRILANVIKEELGMEVPEELRIKDKDLDVDAPWFLHDCNKER